MRTTFPFRVREHVEPSGGSPYARWFDGLETAIQVRIDCRVRRFATGNLGDHRALGVGLFEARFHFGAGYRVYFGVQGRDVILLLLGGDKGSQTRDIAHARALWARHLTENENDA